MANANSNGITGNEKKFLQLMRGVVTNNNDPKRSGRVQVRIFDLHGPGDSAGPGGYALTSGADKDTKYNQVQESGLPWAEVVQGIDFIGFNPAPSDGAEEFANSVDGKGSKSGSKSISRTGKWPGTGYTRILNPGTWVFCILENGNPNKPIVIGTIAADNEIHKNANSQSNRIYDSITGHYEEWNDKDGRVIFHHRSGTTITMDKNGEYFLNVTGLRKEYAGQDYAIHNDANYNSFTQGNSEEIVKGNKKLDLDGNQTLNIKGNQDFTIQGNHTNNTSGNITLKGTMIFLN